MYTGYLDLNIGNIYNILLATHILHMPRALEICRSYLLQTQAMENRTNVIKPIPSRRILMPSQQIFAPAYSNLQKHEDTPFKSVVSERHAQEATATTSKSEDSAGHREQQKPTVQEKQEKPRLKRRTSDGLNGEKVIIDIACCDGPVRFQRVINKNYRLHTTPNLEPQRTTATARAVSENVKEHADENQAQGGDVFTCLYCNHTFKSQYCYQKHARRHLNPVNMDVKTVPRETSKREVKLLDMNVQYYPCKSCGSKFPSYYFVHKHRKQCHAEEMADSSNKNNEMVPETNVVTSSTGEDTSGSNIDVEAINTDN